MCLPVQPWRDDRRCGWEYPLENGKNAECDPNGLNYCCTQYDYCESDYGTCTCEGCTNYKRLYSRPIWQEWTEFSECMNGTAARVRKCVESNYPEENATGCIGNNQEIKGCGRF